LEPLYNQAVLVAKENSWEADETTIQELNIVYLLIDAARYGVADPSEYRETEDMVTVVKQYQVILETMPYIIDKVSKPYVN